MKNLILIATLIASATAQAANTKTVNPARVPAVCHAAAAEAVMQLLSSQGLIAADSNFLTETITVSREKNGVRFATATSVLVQSLGKQIGHCISVNVLLDKKCAVQDVELTQHAIGNQYGDDDFWRGDSDVGKCPSLSEDFEGTWTSGSDFPSDRGVDFPKF